MSARRSPATVPAAGGVALIVGVFACAVVIHATGTHVPDAAALLALLAVSAAFLLLLAYLHALARIGALADELHARDATSRPGTGAP